MKTSTSKPSSPATNCREFLDKRLQVRWELKGDHVEITLAAKIREDQYVAFGLSGAPNKSQMVIKFMTDDFPCRLCKCVDFSFSQNN
jgi:hypothetical protein